MGEARPAPDGPPAVDERKPGLRSVVATGLVLVAFLALDHQLGPASFRSGRLAASVLLAMIILGLGRPGGQGWAPVAKAGAGLVLALGVLLSPTVPLAEACLVLSVCLASSAPRGRSSLPRGLGEALLTSLILRFAADLVPRSGQLAGALGDLASAYVGRVRGTPTALGPTALGAPAIVLATAFLAWRWRWDGSKARGLALLAIPVGWFLLLPLASVPAALGPLVAFGAGAAHGVAWLILAVLVDGLASGGDASSMTPVARDVGSKIRLAIACLAVAASATCLVGTGFMTPPSGRSILVHNRGGLDWERPVFGRFGAFSGGMFGLLPVYCRGNGFDFGLIDRDAIRPDDLARTQVLILINSPRTWEGDERRAVIDFVAGGGSLLILGDHTDVFGLMRGFNSLIGDLGIRFRFDSAYHARPTWAGCFRAAPDSVASRWDLDGPGVGIGASLELRGEARPLLVAKYAFSDAGVRENEMGSYLGNYNYDQGEQLGDLVVAATAPLGRGRVVVWGDTSPFQGGLSYSFPKVVGPLLDLLSRPAPATDRPPARWASAGAFLAIALWLLASRAPSGTSSAVAASLLLGLAGSWTLAAPHLDTPIRADRDAFLVDQSHLPLQGHYEAGLNPTGPLYTNLLRAGYRVGDLERWDARAIRDARGIAFVAPQRSISQGEVGDLLAAEERGAVVLLAVGQPDSAGADALLAAHGLGLAPRPLGTVPAGARAGRKSDREEPRFLDAWPIVARDGGDPSRNPLVEVIYRSDADVIALFRRHGSGGLLLISDTRFFSTMNIEDVSDRWPGNLAFLHFLMRRHLGAEPDAVRPVFASPTKPQ